MSKYKLIAFDMDGTLLMSNNEVSPKTVAMLEKAAEQGKITAVCSGRCVAEMVKYFPLLKAIRYYICDSGAMLYDRQENKVIYQNPIPVKRIREIMEVGRNNKNIMIHLADNESVLETYCAEHLGDYHLAQYKESFTTYSENVDDIFAYYDEHEKPINKINLHFTDPEMRTEVEEKVGGPDLVMSRINDAGIEFMAAGSGKGNGLKKLCDLMGCTIDEAIAVGDAENDRSMLSVAGLPIAMGNAWPSIKELCPVHVADCDSDGCAEAIEKYLLD